MTREDKEYLNERFDAFGKLINANFLNVNERLDRIEEQTKKTNGRVTANENKINDLEKKELTHIQSCPVVPKVEKINEELAEYKMFKKYPKIALALIAGAVLLFLITTFESIEKVKKASTPQNIEILKETGKQLNDTIKIF